MNLPRAANADVALLLEGTFPYVRGGVSSWVNQIIRAFPELCFAIVFLGSRREDYGEPGYSLPDNVVHLEIHYLYDDLPVAVRGGAAPGESAFLELAEKMHCGFAAGERTDQALALFRELAPILMTDGGLPARQFLHGEPAWKAICSHYRQCCTDPSFVDYFWTVRVMHGPLWRLAQVANSLIPARVYHSVSTGYAGFLGALLHHRHGRPLILSEHGIYSKERKIDLFQSEWVRDNRNLFQRDKAEISYLRQIWIHFFEWLGRFCYDAADPIVALYETNRLRQVDDGAPAARTLNIPNGVDIGRLSQLRVQRPARTPPVLCLIGRVVPIKDVKTFIRAMRRVVNRLPEAEGWIAGPEDEDRTYAEECHNLAEGLGLAEQVKFLGFQKLDELLPRIGLTVLSSISEALPLVILEGFAAGVPTVSTDVGACRQLVEGLEPEDRALGVAGRVVRIADPQALADAALSLLEDPEAWAAASRAGMARVERYYSDAMMLGRYRQIYERALAAGEG